MSLSPKTVSLVELTAQSAPVDSVLSELGAFTRAVGASPLLARTLAQADLPEENKKALVSDVVGGGFAPQTVDLIVSGASNASDSRSVVSALFDALSELSFVSAERTTASSSGGHDLKAVEQQLLDMADIVSNSEELRDAFANPGIGDEAKVKVLAELLGSRTPVALREMSLTAISLTHGRGVDALLRERAELAASRRNAAIAVIRSAVELDDARKQRLLAALSSTAGRDIEGRFLVDSTIIGSLVVRIGDEVLDGSVRHKLQQAREALVGA